MPPSRPRLESNRYPMNSLAPLFVTLVSLPLLSASASAQTVLLREGDPSPDGSPGQSVTSIQSNAINAGTGHACFLRTDGLAGPNSMIWGTFGSATPGLLRQPETIGTMTQTGIDDVFGLGANAVGYRSTSDLASGTTGLDSVWSGDTLVAIQGQIVPAISKYFRFMMDPSITESGEPVYVGGMSDSPGAFPNQWGIFRGTVPLVYGGQWLQNMPSSLSSIGVSLDYGFSPSGAHYLVEATLDTGSAADDGALVLDGAGLQVGGALVREGDAVPMSVGGMGDHWDNFDHFALNDSGSYAFSGDTDASSSSDHFLMIDGGPLLREGDVHDGLVLADEVEALAMNASGQVAYLWAHETPFGSIDPALFLDGRCVLKYGDPIDWDGDGVVDPAATLDFFKGERALSLSNDGVLYFAASVLFAGNTFDAFIAMPTDDGLSNNYCQANANTSGLPAVISATGSDVAADNDLTLICSQMPAEAFGFFLNSQTQGFIANPSGSAGNLCLAGTIGRFQGQIQNSGLGGTFQISVDLTALPQPTSTVLVTAGQTWNFSTWFRDSDGMGGATSNFSDGIEILFR